MNILMVNNYYRIGGGEHTVFENEVKMLKDNGHKVITYCKDNKDLDKIQKKILLPLTTIWSIKTYIQVKKIIKKEKIQIIHCHNTFPQISLSIYHAAKKMKIPIIQTIHNFRFVCPNGLCYRNGKICEECINKGLRRSLINKCYRSSFFQTLLIVIMLSIHRRLKTFTIPRYIFLTEFNQNKIEVTLSGIKGYVKPNFYKLCDARSSTFDKNKFIYIGRLDNYKGIYKICKMWVNISDDELHIYGDGEDFEKIKKLDIKNIYLHGFCDKETVFMTLKTACALIFPSECYEGFPMTIIESMSLGVPVLCNDIGNHSRIVKENVSGIHFDINSEKNFISKLQKIKENRMALSQGAIEMYEKKFSLNVNYEKTMKIYKNCMEEMDVR